MKNLSVLLIVFLSLIPAQFSINGDFRVRPRYDLVDGGKYENSKKDFYYMYRARVNLKFDIGDDWSFNTTLGHYGFGGYVFTSDVDYEMANTIEGSAKPKVDFMRLYFGKQSEDWGIIGGIIPVNGFENPHYDVHYYPNYMIDVPYFIRSVDGAAGFNFYLKLGKSKLQLAALSDKNNFYQEDKTGKVLVDKNDGYTFTGDITIPFEGFTIQPMIMVSTAPVGEISPTTAGLNFVLPKISIIDLSGSFIYSHQANEATTEYNVTYVRIKSNTKLDDKSSLLFWIDFAKRTDKLVSGEVNYNFFYYWLMYNYEIYKSKLGKVVISPTIRFNSTKADNLKDYERYKIELTTTISF